MGGDDSTGDTSLIGRRDVLFAAGSALAAAGAPGVLGELQSPPVADADEDGIPDELKRSAAFEDWLADRFGMDDFHGLDIGHRDLILDVRYIGTDRIDGTIKDYLFGLCASHGITLHWLDYKRRYDFEWFESTYGTDTRRILWGRRSFYQEAVESRLQNVAFQLFVVPGIDAGGPRKTIYSPWADVLGSNEGQVNGMNFGNRAVVAHRSSRWEQARLIFHELTHLVLCHDDDPENTGVMGTNAEIDLTESEWERFRGGLDNVRDETGFDVLRRPCLWVHDPGGLGCAMPPIRNHGRGFD